MRKNGHPQSGLLKQGHGPLYLKDDAERLFAAYLDTFKQAPESDFLLKRYVFDEFYEKMYLQDNVFFIPRADFLWFFKYFKSGDIGDRTIELKKRSTSIAEREVEFAAIHIREHYTYEQGAADIIYTRRFEDQEGVEFLLKNTDDAVTQVEQLLADFRADKVMSQPY